MSKDKERSVCFIADRHSLYDDRIYWKMAMSLKKHDYKIYYLLLGDKHEEGISREGVEFTIFKRVKFVNNVYLNVILKKILFTDNHKRILKKAAEIQADVYHFHDLRINKIGKQLKFLPHKPVVIYDAREPYSADIRSYLKGKPFISLFRNVYAALIDRWERSKIPYYDLVITNEELLRDRFRKIFGKEKAEVIYNYTDNYKLYNYTAFEDKEFDFIYTGTITKLRGAIKIIEAVNHAKKKLPKIKGVFIGSYFPASLKDEMQDLINRFSLQENILLMDRVDYSEIYQYYNKSRIGMVTLFPVETFKISMPIKIFEYSTFGLPMIGSNFGHMKKYIEKDRSGLLVDPLVPEEISSAMVRILSDQKLYKELSENGRNVALKYYRWELEEQRLLDFYDKFLEKRNKIV